MSKRKTILSWEEITSIINAEDSDLEDSHLEDIFDHDMEEDVSCDVGVTSDVEICPIVQPKSDLLDFIMMEEEEVNNGDMDEVYESEDNMNAMTINTEDLVIDFIVEDPPYIITKKEQIQWRKRGFNPEPIIFQNDTIPSITTLIRTPYEIFTKYIPNSLIVDMAKFTNMYAVQKGTTFKHTDADEIMKLLGMHILMGVMKFPQVEMYWSNALNITSISSIMSRNRFYSLRTNLHLIDNNTIPNNCDDKFIKVRPIIEAVRKRCCELPVEEIVSVDEQMIPFKGHLNIKQYMKNKPKPWGIKVFVLAGKSGYPYDFIVYQGASTKISTLDKINLGYGAAIVVHLSSRLSVPGHQLFFDNYFSTYQLFEILKQKQINAVGTVRINRFNKPTFTSDKDLKIKGRGSSEEFVSRDGEIVIVKWQVCFIVIIKNVHLILKILL